MKKIEMIKLDNPEDVVEFIKNPIKIAEVVTGVLGSNKSDWVLSTGRIVQASLKFKILQQLGKELEEYSKKGQIKEDYFASNNNQASLYELLKFIDEEVPDEERFKAMKSIFLKSVSKNATEEDERLAYEYMQICKELSGGEILTLKASHDIINGRLTSGMPGITHSDANRSNWLVNIAKQVGHDLPSLVERYEEHLMSLKLISDCRYSDRSGFEPTPFYRLTKLGKQLCEHISE